MASRDAASLILEVHHDALVRLSEASDAPLQCLRALDDAAAVARHATHQRNVLFMKELGAEFASLPANGGKRPSHCDPAPQGEASPFNLDSLKDDLAFRGRRASCSPVPQQPACQRPVRARSPTSDDACTASPSPSVAASSPRNLERIEGREYESGSILKKVRASATSDDILARVSGVVCRVESITEKVRASATSNVFERVNDLESTVQSILEEIRPPATSGDIVGKVEGLERKLESSLKELLKARESAKAEAALAGVRGRAQF